MTEDYFPTDPISYGYVPPYDVAWDLYEDGYIDNPAVEYLVDEFAFHTKNIISHSAACDYYIHALAVQGIKCTNADVEEAYTACYGHGAEYEWDYA